MGTYKHKKPGMKRKGEVKTRLCLMCREAFKSAWSGERVCGRCKSDSSWRYGSGLETEWPVVSRGK